MNTGMQDAFNLAWKLALVSDGACSMALLDSYSVERSAVGDFVLEAAGRLTSISVMKNPAAQAVRNLIGHFVFGLAPFQRSIVESMTEISIAYDKSPLTGHGTHGQRIAPVAGQVPIGAGISPKFALCAERGKNSTRLHREFETLLEPSPRPPLEPGKATLVRPDGYAGCAEDADRPGPIENYLKALLPGI
jgi:hypothetical protein